MSSEFTIIEEKLKLEKGFKEIGQKAVDFWRKGVQWEHKDGHHDIVTEADKSIEIDIRKLIEQNYPGEKILGEESGGEDLGENFWVIDPIDGTTNYNRGGRDWCVAIAKIKQGKFDFAMVYVPFGTEGPELYYTKKGKGAYLDEIWQGNARTVKLQVTQTSELKNATVTTNQEEFWNTDQQVINLINKCRGTCIPGSTTYWLLCTAAGRFDIALTRQKKTWDCIGLLFVEEAGGKVTYFDGSDKFDFVAKGKESKNDFLATNNALHNKAIEILTTK